MWGSVNNASKSQPTSLFYEMRDAIMNVSADDRRRCGGALISASDEVEHDSGNARGPDSLGKHAVRGA